jgi:hypothetical protein
VRIRYLPGLAAAKTASQFRQIFTFFNFFLNPGNPLPDFRANDYEVVPEIVP